MSCLTCGGQWITKRSSGQCHLRNVRCADSDVAGAHIPGRRPAGACQACSAGRPPCVCQVPQDVPSGVSRTKCLLSGSQACGCALASFSCVATSRTEEEMLSQSQGPRRTQMKAGSSRTTLCKDATHRQGWLPQAYSVCGDR